MLCSLLYKHWFRHSHLAFASLEPHFEVMNVKSPIWRPRCHHCHELQCVGELMLVLHKPKHHDSIT